jgi:biotin carboxyl carrier protein
MNNKNFANKIIGYRSTPELIDVYEHETESLKHIRSRRWIVLSGILFFGLFVTLLLLLVYVPWQQSVVGEGRVIAYSPNERPQQIESPLDGRISHWYVSEGEKVTKGAPIAEILDIDPQIMERLQRERDAAQMKLNASEKALVTSQKNLERQKILASRGLSSQRAYELAELEYAKFQADISSVQVELARLDVRISRQSSMQITAPRDGTIMRIYSAQGQVIIKAGDKIATIVPETTDRAVEMFVDGNDLPLLSIGREVRLQFEGWPAIQFVGFPSVAVGTFAGSVGIIDPSETSIGKFRILVFPLQSHENTQPWPSATYLRQGVRTVGWVLLDSVPLGWELWRRMNGFPQAILKKEKGNSYYEEKTKSTFEKKSEDSKADTFSEQKQ